MAHLGCEKEVICGLCDLNIMFIRTLPTPVLQALRWWPKAI